MLIKVQDLYAVRPSTRWRLASARLVLLPDTHRITGSALQLLLHLVGHSCCGPVLLHAILQAQMTAPSLGHRHQPHPINLISSPKVVKPRMSCTRNTQYFVSSISPSCCCY